MTLEMSKNSLFYFEELRVLTDSVWFIVHQIKVINSLLCVCICLKKKVCIKMCVCI